MSLATPPPSDRAPVDASEATEAALFAEGEQDIEQWFQQGFAAVDLETAATYAVAEHFGMERLAMLYAFDNPRGAASIYC